MLNNLENQKSSLEILAEEIFVQQKAEEKALQAENEQKYNQELAYINACFKQNLLQDEWGKKLLEAIEQDKALEISFKEGDGEYYLYFRRNKLEYNFGSFLYPKSSDKIEPLEIHQNREYSSKINFQAKILEIWRNLYRVAPVLPIPDIEKSQFNPIIQSLLDNVAQNEFSRLMNSLDVFGNEYRKTIRQTAEDAYENAFEFLTARQALLTEKKGGLEK